jgi:hypothetical protein
MSEHSLLGKDSAGTGLLVAEARIRGADLLEHSRAEAESGARAVRARILAGARAGVAAHSLPSWPDPASAVERPVGDIEAESTSEKATSSGKINPPISERLNPGTIDPATDDLAAPVDQHGPAPKYFRKAADDEPRPLLEEKMRIV